MKAEQSAYARLILACLIVGGASGLLGVGVRTSSIAQSPQERKLEDEMPKNVPIKIKFKAEKEAKVKDLSNPDWLRDFELEVTNISNKPIYFLLLWLELPDTKSDNNNPLAFTLQYGRIDFIHFNTQPLDTDVPIPPGDTRTLTIPDEEQQGWRGEKLRRNLNDPGKVRIKFVHLSFGDGSGFDGAGRAYPYGKQQSSTVPCRESPVQTVEKEFGKRERIPFPSLQQYSLLATQAANLPASFFDRNFISGACGTVGDTPKRLSWRL